MAWAKPATPTTFMTMITTRPPSYPSKSTPPFNVHEPSALMTPPHHAQPTTFPPFFITTQNALMRYSSFLLNTKSTPLTLTLTLPKPAPPISLTPHQPHVLTATAHTAATALSMPHVPSTPMTLPALSLLPALSTPTRASTITVEFTCGSKGNKGALFWGSNVHYSLMYLQHLLYYLWSRKMRENFDN